VITCLLVSGDLLLQALVQGGCLGSDPGGAAGKLQETEKQ
jgi:hypothetical protein